MKNFRSDLYDKIVVSRLGLQSCRAATYAFFDEIYGDIRALASAKAKIAPEAPDRLELCELIRRRLGSVSATAAETEKALAAFENMVQLSAKKFGGRVRVRALSIFDRDYPEALRRIQSPPPVIFVAGSRFGGHSRNFSVVGTRKPSEYALSHCRKFCRELASAGMTLVSGLAAGIDGCVHEAALDAGAATYAVLGSGFDVPTPASSSELYARVLENGSVISEYPPGAASFKSSFVYRNRIISGLSTGTLVAAAGEGSGALITAGYSREQGRAVFALTGDMGREDFAGCHELIRESRAKLVLNVADIFSGLGLKARRRRTAASGKTAPEELGPGEKAVYESVKKFGSRACPPSVDEIASTLEGKMAVQEIMAALTKLEIEGMVKSLSAKRYAAVI